MRKLYYFVSFLIVIALSCNKPAETSQLQNVIFTATANSSGLKTSCDNPDANYALIQIDETIHQVDVYYLNGKIYTQTLKLIPDEYTLYSFALVYSEDLSGDIITLVVPETGDDYASFVSKPLPFNFNVNAFAKAEISVEVVCYDPTVYDSSGFGWFGVDLVTIREFCFFGDICIIDEAELLAYENTIYANQTNGVEHDMPAIFKIDVYRNNVFVKRYSNEGWLGEDVLCVQYADYEGIDNFEFRLSIKILDDNGIFDYVYFHTWTSTDASALYNLGESIVFDIGTDNLVDFVLGECVPDADLIIPPPDNPPPDPDPTVLDLCFIGDICIDDLTENDYTSSAYDGLTVLDQNMPAIFKIDIENNGQPIASHSNDISVEDGKLCFSYTDYPNTTDNFEFTLSILVIDGSTFLYKEFYSWTSTDADDLIDEDNNPINFNGDGILDFILGDCDDADLELPPYTNPDPPSPEPEFTGEETAFAFDPNGLAICFDTITEITSDNWGFSNGPYSQNISSYTLELYAGAGGCTLSNGYHVGYLTLSYNTYGQVSVTYNLFPEYSLGEIHLYVGETNYQYGNESVAPGQFPYKEDEIASGINTYTFNLTDIFTGHIYIIAHADINGT